MGIYTFITKLIHVMSNFYTVLITLSIIDSFLIFKALVLLRKQFPLEILVTHFCENLIFFNFILFNYYSFICFTHKSQLFLKLRGVS